VSTRRTGRNELRNLVPERAVTEAWRDGKKVAFQFPRFRSFPGRWFARALGVSRFITLTLDEVATAVWDLVDGRRTVEQIGEELVKQFGAEVEPLPERLGELITTLERNRAIRFGPGPARPPGLA